MSQIQIAHIHAPIMPPSELRDLFSEAQDFYEAIFVDDNGYEDIDRFIEASDQKIKKLAQEFVDFAEQDSASEDWSNNIVKAERERHDRHLSQYTNILILYREALKAASKDGLTGLFNKKSFRCHLEKQLSILQEKDNSTHTRRKDNFDTNKTGAVLFIDLDKFKPINDTYGHGVGDEVLQLVAKTLKQVRPNDVVGRVGGDEFVILLNNVTSEEAQIAKNRIDEELNKLTLEIDHEGQKETISIHGSVGMAILEAGMTAEQVEEIADKDMYATKQAKGVERKPAMP